MLNDSYRFFPHDHSLVAECEICGTDIGYPGKDVGATLQELLDLVQAHHAAHHDGLGG